ncbi:CRISPR-associated protein Csd1 [Roseinatronobacter thiooxidans]|uniref:CRISPR-associated protein Csd1 n=1 Tax=Roseinatronobacter thiooxidans TaxID=121821 RepID=A0A2W7Q978_9RHOB|nr:type I-C CRISPR-associated protein Cas8c/Csd1 [Roseinatronobacter thiooxidans]PZX44643.1 CRISPR-associated protein Csd1 [Roseinatronobacter thiooxidans]
MTILASLARLYDRMAEKGEAPRPGFSTENISFAVVLDTDGTPLRLADKRSLAGKKPAPVPMAVPEPPKDRRGLKIVPGFLWDPSPYSLGVSANSEKKLSLTSDNAHEKFSAFREKHLDLLKDTDDLVLLSVAKFLENWKPAEIERLPGFSPELLKTNIVFEIDAGGERGFAHERAAIRKLPIAVSDAHTATCLVYGEIAPITRLHPMFGSISDKQAAIVSFNIGSKDERGAASSYGKTQGDNAPVSEAAAFAYGTALNALLARGSTRNIRIADTTVAFWAEAPDPEVANMCDIMMGDALNPRDEMDARNELRAALQNVAEGRAGGDPRLDPQARVYMLGLAPNAARLSVRFWYPGTFGDFARNVTQFWDDLSILPAPWKGPPAVWSLLYETALRVGGRPKPETISPLLGGQVMRAVLTGQPLPRMLLSAVIGRIRADGDINGRRAAICKAVINRASKQEGIPVSLDPDNTNPAYCLGRLFAAYAYAEQSYAKRNATIRDKYLAGASANPARVFPLLMRGYEHNRSGLMKVTDQRRGSGVKADRAVSAILELLDGAQDLPTSLNMDDQGKFFVGFYHQWNAFFQKPEEAADAAADPILENFE